MPRKAVGVDLGGTNAKIALVDASGKVLRDAVLPTMVSAGPAEFVKRVSRLIDSWRLKGPLRLGLGLAGDVDSERRLLRFTPNLRGWDGFAFGRAFQKALGNGHVITDNDANCAVWGAYVVELKRKPGCVVGVTLGTGVGGGLVIGGRLHRGCTGSAGEIGHTIVEMDGEPCHCGKRGCLEAYAGSYGIARTAREEAERRPDSLLYKLCPDTAALSPAHVTAAADQGDPAAIETWKRIGRRLGVGLSNAVQVLNPDVLLLLGGVSRAGKWLMDPVREAFSVEPFRTPFSKVQVRLADNKDIGCVGAALLALERPS